MLRRRRLRRLPPSPASRLASLSLASRLGPRIYKVCVGGKHVYCIPPAHRKRDQVESLGRDDCVGRANLAIRNLREFKQGEALKGRSHYAESVEFSLPISSHSATHSIS